MKNVLTGNSGEVGIFMGDYSYTTGSGKNRREYEHTVCILQSEELDTPHCSLRPQSRLLDYLGGLFGGQDIDFDDDLEFSGAYVLQGESEKSIRDLFDARLRAWFVGRRGYDFHFETLGNVLMFHNNRRLPPEQTQDFMQQALEICELLGKLEGKESKPSANIVGDSLLPFEATLESSVTG